MTDRELLEAAAKAAGIDAKWNEEWQLFVRTEQLDPDKPSLFGGKRSAWVPLDDDGDALRLAVKLGISVEQDSEVAEVITAFMVGRSGYNTTESYGPMRDGSKDDPYAATRRAIVRAAAAMAG